MGWNPFKSKTRIDVFSSAVKLVEREASLLSQSVCRAILNEQNISNAIAQDTVNGLGSNITRAYHYGESDYHYGLPQGTTESREYYEEDLINAIEAATTTRPTEIVYHDRDAGDPAMEAQWYADSVLKRDPTSGKIQATLPANHLDALAVAHSQFDVDRDDELLAQRQTMESTYPKTIEATESGFDTDGTPCTLVTIDVQSITTSHTTTNDFLYDTYQVDTDFTVDANGLPTGFSIDMVTYHTSIVNGTIHSVITTERTITPRYTDGSLGESYTESVPTIHAWDTVDFSERGEIPLTISVPLVNYDIRSQKYYVGYKVGDVFKTWFYDTADGTYPLLEGQEGETTSPFYPVVPIRYDNQDLCAESEQDTERYITSRRLLQLLNLDILDLATGINENPDIDEIDHAYFMMGVQLQADTESGCRYLGGFFEHIMQASPDNGTAPGGIHIKEGGLDMYIGWDKITTQYKTGRIGKKGFAKSATELLPVVETTEDSADDTPPREGFITYSVQVDDDIYREVTVYNPTHTNLIYSGKSVETHIEDSMDEDNMNFIIPLHHAVVQDLPVRVRNELYYDSMHMVFYSYKLTKVKWYEQAWFASFLKIVGFVLMVMSFGTATSLSQALWALAEAAVYSYAFKLIVSAISPELALLVAIAMAAVGMYQGFKNNWAIEGTFAENLLQLSNGLNSGIQGHLGDAFKDLQAEIDAFSKNADEKMDALDAINKEFELTGILDPMEFIDSQPLINLNESVTDYYQRTIHTGNVGTLAYDIIENYHSMMLELPKPEHSFS